MKEEAERIKKEMRMKKKNDEPIPRKNYLSSGSRILNKACTGKTYGFCWKGLYILFVGDSNSGKTFIALTCLAEAAKNPEFDNFEFLYDNSESATPPPIKKYFGSKVHNRLLPLHGTKKSPRGSSTLEEFYDGILSRKKPFICILDSMDSLVTSDEVEYDKAGRKAREDGTKQKGTYGMAKPKINSAKLRLVCNKLKRTGSILIVISQTRQNIGWNAKFNPKTRSGGDALRFYARLEFWSSVAGRIIRKSMGKKRKVGIFAKINIVKNHLTGWEGMVKVPIYRQFGIDDTGSLVDFLIEERWWRVKKGIVNAKEFDVELEREKLIEYIETRELQADLYKVFNKHWNAIEESCEIKRTKRYT